MALRALRTIALALILAGVVVPAASPRAGLWSSDTAAGYGLADEVEELRRTRERLVRRQAMRRALDRRVGDLDQQIGLVLRQARQVRDALLDAQHGLRAQERELDRIVPRLVDRANATRERRAQVAGVLADVASLSRRDGLDPTIRARMRAIGPALLEQLRADTAATAALERQGERVADRQRSLAQRVPILLAEVGRLGREGERRTDQRDSAVQNRVWLEQEVQRLSAASARLGRQLLVVEAAHAARAEPQAGRPTAARHLLATAWPAGGSVRGQAAPAPRLAQGAAARQQGLAQVEGAAPGHALVASLGSTVAARAPGLPPARSVAEAMDLKSPAGPSHLVAGRAQLVPALSEVVSVAGLSSRISVGRLPRPEPIRPSLSAVANRFRTAGEPAGIAIAAVPGQAVAAPEGGRILFADAFKSYGLLLIIQHDNEYHTVLWGFSRLQVGVGDEVQGGQIIGVMDVVDGALPELHVELRRNGRPVNPLPWLAASSSKVRG